MRASWCSSQIRRCWMISSGVQIRLICTFHYKIEKCEYRGGGGCQHCYEPAKRRDLIQPCTPPESQGVESTRLCTRRVRSTNKSVQTLHCCISWGVYARTR
jgi:hypothetical protein